MPSTLGSLDVIRELPPDRVERRVIRDGVRQEPGPCRLERLRELRRLAEPQCIPLLHRVLVAPLERDKDLLEAPATLHRRIVPVADRDPAGTDEILPRQTA